MKNMLKKYLLSLKNKNYHYNLKNAHFIYEKLNTWDFSLRKNKFGLIQSNHKCEDLVEGICTPN